MLPATQAAAERTRLQAALEVASPVERLGAWKALAAFDCARRQEALAHNKACRRVAALHNLTTAESPMHQQLTAGLIALAAHVGPEALDLEALPFFRQFEADASKAAAIAGHLSEMQNAAHALRYITAPNPSLETVLGLAKMSVLAGLRALVAATGALVSNESVVLREAGRLVVKNAFPFSLSAYAAGSYGDFEAYRLPLQACVLNVGQPHIKAQVELATALKAARKLRAEATRQQVQDNPNTAIRSVQTGKPIAKFDTKHWEQLTWRLGYTTPFDLLVLAAEHATDAPAPAELLPALLRLVEHYSQVFSAYLAPVSGRYGLVAEAFFVVLPTPTTALAA